MRAVGVALAISLFACGSRGGGDDGGNDIASFDRVVLEPDTATLTVALGQTGTQDYKVFGVKQDGTRVDVTSLCSLDLADNTFGTFAGATVTVAARGGKTNVNAACEDKAASGVLIINLSGSIVVPPAPDNSADLFDSATPTTDAARTPTIEYPLDKAVSPLNIPSVEVQYTTAQNDLFHVTLTSSYGTISVYTLDAEALLTGSDWAAIAQTAAGENLSFGVEALRQSDPGSKYVTPQTVVTMSTDVIDQTAIYWWTSNSPGSIVSQRFGKTDPPELVRDNCTSCHSVSRSGTRIGYSRCVPDCSPSHVGFLKYDALTATWKEQINADDLAIPGSFTTFAPIGNPFPTDDEAVALVNRTGNLALYNPDTGAEITTNVNATAAIGGRAPMMPDWSPDGTKVVYALGNAGQYIDIGGGQLAIMDYAYTNSVHTFSNARVITPDPVTVNGQSYNNYFFPSFSPDNQLIVFNNARENWRKFSMARTAGSRLMLTTPTGEWVNDLAALNGPGDQGITWPHWAPTNSNDYYWVVLSSERDYGHRTTKATSAGGPCIANGVETCKQIWIGAIAKNKIGPGMDPSSPPMWMPGQKPDANNISPFWTRPATIQ